ncbi:MAG: Histidine triad domain protein [Parcubacteria group bacterium]|nr:Histidine triad domain protein [Parcubacteria group bacterium]
MLAALPDEFPGFSALPREIRYLMGCGNFEQFLATYQALAKPFAYCPFCDGQEKEETYIMDTMHWVLRHNEFPAKGTKLMLLIVPKKHITDPLEFTTYDGQEIMTLFRHAINHFKIAGGALVMRFGDPQFHSGTVPHLHWNIIWPAGNVEYRVALAKDDDAREENYRRLLGFRVRFNDQGGESVALA